MSISAKPSDQRSTGGVTTSPVSDAALSLLYTRETIAGEVNRLAGEISRDYRELNPLLVGVLNGVFVFMADLVRAIDIPLEVDFVRARSYLSTNSTGDVRVSGAERLNVQGRHVVLVDDIIDTGQTTAHLLDLFRHDGPESVALCCLLENPCRRTAEVNIDYRGLTIPNKFIVGYGLDLDQRWRNLPDIYTIEESDHRQEAP